MRDRMNKFMHLFMKKLWNFSIWLLLILIFGSITAVITTVTTVVQATVHQFGGGFYEVAERLATHELPYDITHLTDRSASGLSSADDSQVVNVLDIPASEEVKIIPWSKLSASRWNLATLTSMAEDFEADNPGYRVIAGINGDFFDISADENLPYATEGVHAAFGQVYKSTDTSSVVRNPIGFKNDGSTKPIVGNVPYQVTEHMKLTVYNQAGDVIRIKDIDRVNEAPGAEEIALYYANWDTDKKIVTEYAPEGYIVENATYALAFSPTDFYGLGTITGYGNKGLGEGEFSIVSNDALLNMILDEGVQVRVQYEFSGAFAGIENATGAGLPIIYDGVFQPDTSSFGTARHPRTMIGSKSDGSIVMCTVDGRQVGMTGVAQPEMAAIMDYYGCVDAYNLDGGGSTTMIILQDGEFEIANTPSNGTGDMKVQRSDANCLLVVVKVPNIEYKFSLITGDTLTLMANIVDYNGFEFEDLYVSLNHEMKKVEAGMVTFSELESNTPYTFDFYYYEAGNFRAFTIQDSRTTAKKTPKVEGLELLFEGDTLKAYVDFFDPDDALERYTVTIGDESKIISNGVALFYRFDGSMSPFFISYSYNTNDDEGRIDVVLEHPPIQCHLDVLMKMTQDCITELLNSFLGS